VIGHQVKRVAIAIVGGSGSGKSWLADRLQKLLGKSATRLSEDDFYLDRSHLAPARRAQLNFDHPRAIDWNAFEAALNNLLSGKTARVPCYDFSTHCRAGREKTLKSQPFILAEGLWLLRRPSVRRLFARTIFLDCPATTRLKRRLERDQQARGRTEASIRKQFRETVEPMHRLYVQPQDKRANLVLKPGWGELEIAAIAGDLLSASA